MLRTAARTTTVAVGLAAVVVTGAGVATATAQLTGNVISACVADKTGAVRIPADGSCRTGESKMEWNKQGPAGPAGTSAPVTVLRDAGGTIPAYSPTPGQTAYISHNVSVPAGQEKFVRLAGKANLSWSQQGPDCYGLGASGSPAHPALLVDGEWVGTFDVKNNTYRDTSVGETYGQATSQDLFEDGWALLGPGDHTVAFGFVHGVCPGAEPVGEYTLGNLELVVDISDAQAR